MSPLTFNGTVMYCTAFFTIHQFAEFSLSIWERAVWIIAMAHFHDRLDFFIFLIQAFARDALLEETNKGVLVTGVAR